MFDFRFDTTVALRNVLLLCHIGTAFLLTVILALQWSTFEFQGADIFFDDNSISSISYRWLFWIYRHVLYYTSVLAPVNDSAPLVTEA